MKTIFKYSLALSLLSCVAAYANDTANSASFDFGSRVVQRSLEVDGNVLKFNQLNATKKTMLELTASSMFSKYFGVELVVPLGRLEVDKTTNDLFFGYFTLRSDTQISYQPGVAIYTKFQLPINDRLRGSLLLGMARDRYEVKICQINIYSDEYCGSNSKRSSVFSAGFGFDYKTTDRLSLLFGYQWRQQTKLELFNVETSDGREPNIKLGSSSWSLGMSYQF